VIVEPGARLLHGVTVLDAVDGDGHFRCIPEWRYWSCRTGLE
jgi:hypothetical protein